MKQTNICFKYLWQFKEVLRLMVVYMKVLKVMILYGDFENLWLLLVAVSLGFEKILDNTFPMNGLEAKIQNTDK